MRQPGTWLVLALIGKDRNALLWRANRRGARQRQSVGDKALARPKWSNAIRRHPSVMPCTGRGLNRYIITNHGVKHPGHVGCCASPRIASRTLTSRCHQGRKQYCRTYLALILMKTSHLSGRLLWRPLSRLVADQEIRTHPLTSTESVPP